MRFRPTAIPLTTYGAISLFNLYVILLHLQGNLVLYIHPRYILFALVFNTLSLLACSVGFVTSAASAPKNASLAADGDSPDAILSSRDLLWRPSFTFVVAAFLLGTAYLLPAAALSSDTAQQRAGNLNTAVVPSLTALDNPNGPTNGAHDGTPSGTAAGTAASASTKTSSPLSWDEVVESESNLASYKGRQVDVVGFVFHPAGAQPDVFYVSRFVITCCAVDARPIGLPVHSPGWQRKFEEDGWVRLQGDFVRSQAVNGAFIVEPARLSSQTQPPNPYVN